MLTHQLSLTFYTRYLGADRFKLLSDSYAAIVDDGHFEELLSQKKLAALLFENCFDRSFFDGNGNLANFCYALPEKTQTRIKAQFGISDFNELKWTNEVSDYFVDELKLSGKFREKLSLQPVNHEGYHEYGKPAHLFKKLKRYQSVLFFDVFEYIRDTNFARCIIQMPTGSGKTRTAMEIVCESMNETGRDVLWLANTEELCDQAFGSFHEVWRFLGKRDARAINHVRVKKVSHDVDLPTFHVASLQGVAGADALIKLSSKGIRVEDIELLIVDEAHVAIAPTYKSAITAIATAGAKLIGLTATPGRQLRTERGSQENKLLSDFFFSKLFEIDTGSLPPIEYLRRGGMLSNARFHSIEGAKIDSILSPNELRKCIDNKTIPKKVETFLSQNTDRTAAIFEQLLDLLKAGRKIIFFGTSVAHSEMISTLIALKGFSSAHIDGATGPSRRSLINSFKDGDIQILCNYGVLSTGFDDPQIDVVFMARPTNSIVLYSQIIGRGLRGPLLGGTDTCDIYTVFDNIVDLPNNHEIYSYFDDYFINSY